jgi:hypothetical protein
MHGSNRVLESVIRGMSAMVEQAPPAASHRSPPGRPGAAVAGAGGGHLLLPVQKLDPAQVWAAITDMTWLELATLSLLAIWNLCTYAFV